LLTAMEPA